MYDKRGISAVVATVLIILLSIVAVSILWMIISGMLKIDSRDIGTKVNIVISEGYTVCDIDKRLLIVQVKRGPDKEVIDKVDLSFSFEGNSYNMKVDAPEPNGISVYSFDIGEFDKCFDSVAVAPIFNENGIEDEGVMGPDVEIPEKMIIDVPAVSIPIDNPDAPDCLADSDCDDGDSCTIDFCDGGTCSDVPLGVDCSDMIAWWRFDDDLTDETGNYDGTAVGSVGFVDSGIVNRGMSIDLDGTGDYVSVPDINFGEDDNWTVVYWYEKSGGFYPGAIGSTGTSSDFRHYGCTVYKIALDNGQHSSHYEVPNGCTTPRNVAFVMNSNLNELDAYVDSTTFVPEPGTRTSSIFSINALGSGGVDSWNGQLDEMMIFNKALSQVEIDILYAVFA